jgi:hypothetical protein
LPWPPASGAGPILLSHRQTTSHSPAAVIPSE